MKRDMDLIRAILIGLETREPGHGPDEIVIEGYDPDETSAHVRLAHEGGLIEAYDASTLEGDSCLPDRLTWSGHDFLAAARSETLWQQAKARVASTAGSVSIEVMKAVLVDLAKNTMGIQ